jgi:hypothetical protein
MAARPTLDTHHQKALVEFVRSVADALRKLMRELADTDSDHDR